MKDIITTDDILGKEVVNSEGEVIGIAQKIHVHKYNKEILGVTVDGGFMKPDLFVGLDNIKLFGVDAIMLNNSSDLKYKGLSVFDKDGTLVGHVSEVIKAPKTGRIQEIIIKKGLSHESIPAKEIKYIGVNVLLK